MTPTLGKVEYARGLNIKLGHFNRDSSSELCKTI